VVTIRLADQLRWVLVLDQVGVRASVWVSECV